MNESDKPVSNSDLIDQLMGIIKKMPQGEQYSLLNELEERFPKLKRKHYRRTIRASVEYAAGDRTDKGFEGIDCGYWLLYRRDGPRMIRARVVSEAHPQDLAGQPAAQGGWRLMAYVLGAGRPSVSGTPGRTSWEGLRLADGGGVYLYPRPHTGRFYGVYGRCRPFWEHSEGGSAPIFCNFSKR